VRPHLASLLDDFRRYGRETAIVRHVGVRRRVTSYEEIARLAGRFAALLVEKGYVSSYREAFDDYLDESAKGYVYRREPQFAEGVERIRKAGGIASLAHPVRVRGDVPALMPELCAAGSRSVLHHDGRVADDRAGGDRRAGR